MKKNIGLDYKKILSHINNLNKKQEYRVMKNGLSHNSINTVVFDNNSSSRHFFNFSHDIAREDLKVSDQKRSGRCWLFAALNYIRNQIATKLEAKNFELSQSYIHFWDKYEKAYSFLKMIDQTKKKSITDRKVCYILQDYLGDGGYFNYISSLIKKYYVVPQIVMPETFQSSNTFVLNHLYSFRLKIAAKNIRESKNDSEAIIKKTMKDIYNILIRCYGVPPKKFDFEYLNNKNKIIKIKDLTPQIFYEKFVTDRLDSFITVGNYSSLKFNQNYLLEIKNVYDSSNLPIFNVDTKLFKFIALNSILNKNPVWFAANVDCFLDLEKGIFDDQLYTYEKSFNMSLSDDKKDLLLTRHSVPNHAMLLVGADIDCDKTARLKNDLFEIFLKNKNEENLYNVFSEWRINRWKIENSWGTKFGKSGIFMMTDSWFEKYVFEIVVNPNSLKEIFNKFMFINNFAQEKMFLSNKTVSGTSSYLYDCYIANGMKTKPIILPMWSEISNKLNGDSNA